MFSPPCCAPLVVRAGDRERAGRVEGCQGPSCGGKTQLPFIPSTGVRGGGGGSGGVQRFSHYGIHGWGNHCYRKENLATDNSMGLFLLNKQAQTGWWVFTCVCVYVGALNTEEQRAGKVRTGQYGKATYIKMSARWCVYRSLTEYEEGGNLTLSLISRIGSLVGVGEPRPLTADNTACAHSQR